MQKKSPESRRVQASMSSTEEQTNTEYDSSNSSSTQSSASSEEEEQSSSSQSEKESSTPDPKKKPSDQEIAPPTENLFQDILESIKQLKIDLNQLEEKVQWAMKNMVPINAKSTISNPQIGHLESEVRRQGELLSKVIRHSNLRIDPETARSMEKDSLD